VPVVGIERLTKEMNCMFSMDFEWDVEKSLCK
jgi:hypothetical protein